LKSDIASYKQAATNADQAISVLQTADGGAARIGDILNRMVTLATEAISGSVDNTARGYIDAEYQELLTEIDSIVGATLFGNTTLLDGAYSQEFLVGADGSAAGATNNRITVTIADITTTGLGINGGDLTSAANAETAYEALSGDPAAATDGALGILSDVRANLGASISRFEFRSDVIATSLENLQAANSSIEDADIAQSQTDFTNAQTLTNAAVAALGKANQLPQELLRLVQQ
jgi:flagellin